MKMVNIEVLIDLLKNKKNMEAEIVYPLPVRKRGFNSNQ
jgi:hypothetical protein